MRAERGPVFPGVPGWQWGWGITRRATEYSKKWQNMCARKGLPPDLRKCVAGCFGHCRFGPKITFFNFAKGPAIGQGFLIPCSVGGHARDCNGRLTVMFKIAVIASGDGAGAELRAYLAGALQGGNSHSDTLQSSSWTFSQAGCRRRRLKNFFPAPALGIC